ncbi:MAG: C40 family peptidase [Clostridium sp.]|jgi:cell wall-associated NlpC family hydrolase|nr:C40 family peptidase [Clostridium sp.]
MKKKKFRYGAVIASVLLSALCPPPGGSLAAFASTVQEQEVERQIQGTQQKLEEITGQIDALTDAQDLIEEKIDDLNAEVINMLTSIGLKEDEIAGKEEEIRRKEAQIAQAQKEYEAAKKREEEHYRAMKIHTKNNYENGNVSLLSYFLESSDFGDMLNRADYIKKVQEYDKKLLDEYEAIKNQVYDLWGQLETDKRALEADKAALERDREDMKVQKAELEKLLTKKRQESANYDAEIAKAKQEAATAKKKLQQEQQQLKKLQEQKKASNAASGNYTPTSYTSMIDSASGSDLGKKIAKYACQFVGNPYVAGGTSLTNGADCSGFTYRVYQDFGYKLPRTSYEQRGSGASVSYDQAQPGDLICYDGHVGIYIGGGYIVHASSAKTGIKVSAATYRGILAVRRVI